MKKLHLFYSCFLFLFLFTNCKKENYNQDFSALTKAYFDDKNSFDPLGATQNGQHQFDGQLQLDMTDAYRKKLGEFYKKYLQELKKIEVSMLSPDEKVSFDIMQWEINRGQDLLELPTNLMPIHQFWGTHLTMAQFAGGTSAQPFATEKDYLNFLNRIEKYAVWIDSSIVYMKKGISQKTVLPKALVVKLIPQFEDSFTQDPKDNLFYAAIKLMPAQFSDATKKSLSAKYASAIDQRLNPSFQKMTAFLKIEYLPAALSSSGIGSLPQGEKMYAAFAKMWTTTDLKPEEIHELGLKEVARLKNEMEKVKKQVGYKGDLVYFFNDLRKKPALKPFKKPEEVIANFEAIYNRIKPNVDKLFSLQPKTPFQIKRTEAFREKTASAEYQQGAADGSRPGTFYVPIPDVSAYSVLEDEDLFLHEAIPGHHFQISLQQENQALPDFRRFNWFGAYGEGWALYCESLGKELGLYQDPYQYLGMLNNEMHRAIRLVVDTGLHSKGWSREQAIQYSLENEAAGIESITAEIERYMAIPGQALSYKIGQLKIMELRRKAELKFGKNFDIRVFHQKVLESGVMPLALLEQKINAWIEE